MEKRVIKDRAFMKKIIIISDLFKEDYESAKAPCGGAELNDHILFSFLEDKGIVKHKIHSNEFETNQMISFFDLNKDCLYLISNFSNLHFRAAAFLQKNCKYIIYEHDYKFHKYRNPLRYTNFIVPKDEIINLNFYKSAEKVICLSKLHHDIFLNNLSLENLHNTTCSLWSDETLEYIENILETKKNNKLAIVNSENPIKRRDDCIRYCQKNKINFDLISSPDYNNFLSLLSKYEGIVILPGHPEPTPRVAVEAKMLNCKIYSNKKSLGIASEEWFNLNGKELIEEVKNIRERFFRYMEKEILNEI